MSYLPTAPSRRLFLAGTALTLSSFVARALTQPALAADGYRIIRIRKGAVRSKEANSGQFPFPTYEDLVPGPAIRIKQGNELKVRFINELRRNQAVYWHGVRLPAAIGGILNRTQPTIAPGGVFDFRLTVKDAGTFWYRSFLQTELPDSRRLYGPLIVEEPTPVAADRDIVWLIDDWPDGTDDTINFASSNRSHATVNGDAVPDIRVRTNERVRLRIINAAVTRIIGLRFDRHDLRVMAVDGQPAQPFLARNGRVALGPGNRIDLFVDMALAAGATAEVFVSDAGHETVLARLRYERGEPFRPKPLGDPEPLPANPLPERIDLAGSLKLGIALGGDVLGGAQNSTRAPMEFAPAGLRGPPLFAAKRGRSVTLAFKNGAATPYVIHLHGHCFRLLDKLDDGWKPFWLDTHVIAPKDTARIAFVADNPGQWIIQCRPLNHGSLEKVAWFEVT